jgi:hypothetical protein
MKILEIMLCSAAAMAVFFYAAWSVCAQQVKKKAQREE